MKTEPLEAGAHAHTPSREPAIALDSKGRSPRTDLACLGILALVWIAMVALANPIGDFPLNDDWVYGLAVKSILELGEFRLPSPASANLYAQAYWGALFCLPFGFSFTALRASTLTLGLVGVWATFGILRELGAGSRFAVVAAALVASNPLYFALANTFMTDVPFFAVAAGSLFYLVRWTFGLDGRDAVLGLLLSMIAILIRQAAIVIPFSFALAYVVKRGPGLRTIVVAGIPLLIGVALHFGFQAWLQHAGRTPLLAEPPLLATVAGNFLHAYTVPVRLFTFVVYVGLFSLPILAAVSLRVWELSDTAQRRSSLAVFVAASAASVAGVIAIGTPMPFIDNVLNDFGIGPLTLTDTHFARRNYPVVPVWLKAFWNAATLAGVLGTAMLASMVAYGLHGIRSRPLASGSTPAMIVIVGSGVAYTLLGALALRFFYDRYVVFLLLSVVLFTGFLSAGTSSKEFSRRGTAVLTVVLALQATFTVVATRDYLEWNRTRWTVTSALVAAGVPRTSIDGGYEFNGWYGYDPAYQTKPGKSPYWVTDDEYIIASGPLSGYSIIQAYPVRRLLTGRDSQLVVLRRNPR